MSAVPPWMSEPVYTGGMISHSGGGYASGGYVDAGGREGVEVALYLSDDIGKDRLVGYITVRGGSPRDCPVLSFECTTTPAPLSYSYSDEIPLHEATVVKRTILRAERRTAGTSVSEMDLFNGGVVKTAADAARKLAETAGAPRSYRLDEQTDVHFGARRYTLSWWGMKVDSDIFDRLIDNDNFRFYGEGTPDREAMMERLS